MRDTRRDVIWRKINGFNYQRRISAIIGSGALIKLTVGWKFKHDRRKSFRRMFTTVINNNVLSGKNTIIHDRKKNDDDGEQVCRDEQITLDQ